MTETSYDLDDEFATDRCCGIQISDDASNTSLVQISWGRDQVDQLVQVSWQNASIVG